MKSQLLIGLLVWGVMMSARAAVYVSADAPQAIPDGTPIGVTSIINISGAGSVLSGVTLTLDITGGNNGDLYAYLSYNGMLVPLLNRVGTGAGDVIQQTFGYSTFGFDNITLSSNAGSSSNIHDVENPLSSPTFYAPDGGNLLTFGGTNPNGTWTLFLADLSGGGNSTLEGWSLAIEAVPEPTSMALVVFGGVLVFGRLCRYSTC